ncbi:hypothetical protein OA90_27100 [Labrenzia sp. OB1]|nr:hypothetical protein OA90_27100 [Labrenzia sp. OB1]
MRNGCFSALRLRIRKFRYLPIAFLSVIMMLACILMFSLFIDQTMSDYMREHEEEMALQEAKVVARLVSLLPGDFSPPPQQIGVKSERFAALHREIGLMAATIGARITIIARNGLVLGDTDMSYGQLLHAANHAKRPEVIQALEHGFGLSERRSATLDINFLYSAVPLERNGIQMIARVALPLKHFYQQQNNLRKILVIGAAFGMLFIIAITFWLGRALAKSIQSREERLDSQVRERTSTLSALQELGSLLAICNNLPEAGEILESHLPQLLPRVSGALALMNNSRNLLVVSHEWGGTWKKGEFKSPDSCWSLRKNTVHHSHKGELVCRHLKDSGRTDAVCIPLMAQGEVVGVIHLKETPKRTFTDMELDIAKSIGKETAIAVSNLKLRETLEQQALLDPLTRLYNRRYLEERFDRLIARADREEMPFWLLIIDVDHFKKYNDQFGHDAGDFVLTQLAKLFHQHTSETHTACRLGGEEFAIVISGIPHEEAMAFSEALRLSVENLPFTFEGRPLGQVTISAGLASYPQDGDRLSSLLKTGDERLYVAKHRGRNQICDAALVEMYRKKDATD